jgi:hypothetical protein
MNPFSRTDSLTKAAADKLGKIRNASLLDNLMETDYNTSHRSALRDIPTLYYFEKPENLQIINAFIKRFLGGEHINCIDAINRLNLQLNTIGLSIHDYDGESGTYEVSQYGNSGGDHPFSGAYVADDQLFLRSKLHAKMGIRKTAVPGGMYTLDAELYVTKKP